MKSSVWRPADEAEATNNIAAFVEWLRATGWRPDANPDDVLDWWTREPKALLEAFADFAGAGPSDAASLAEQARRVLVADERPGVELDTRSGDVA